MLHTTDFRQLEADFSNLLDLRRRPVAVMFGESAPGGVPKFEGIAPSGCSFWRLAAEGRSFYTVPKDHYNCAIGCYTHNIPLPAERAEELSGTLSLMTGIGYIRAEEVGGIVRLPRTPGVVVYAPLGEVLTDPDVVLFAGRPGRLMLLQEAALRAGIGSSLQFLARPTCMALPASLARGVTASSGCVGNRVYTGLEEDELYVAVPGRDLVCVAEATRTIVSANAELTEYHRQRRQTLTAD
jgi:uncharacterized protein (DUF169 family)